MVITRAICTGLITLGKWLVSRDMIRSGVDDLLSIYSRSLSHTHTHSLSLSLPLSLSVSSLLPFPFCFSVSELKTEFAQDPFVCIILASVGICFPFSSHACIEGFSLAFIYRMGGIRGFQPKLANPAMDILGSAFAFF